MCVVGKGRRYPRRWLRRQSQDCEKKIGMFGGGGRGGVGRGGGGENGKGRGGLAQEVKVVIYWTTGGLSALSYSGCSHINSHNQVRGHRAGSSHSGVQERGSEEVQQTKSCTRNIIAEARHVIHPPKKTIKIGSQHTYV